MKNRRAVIKATLLVFFLALSLPALVLAQTLGGNAAYNFLLLPNTPQLAALGGINVSNISADAGLAYNNPALLRQDMLPQLHASFNSMYAGIKNYHCFGGFYYEKWKINLAAGLKFINYGSIAQTDAAGNVMGDFHPTDYSAQVSASGKYAQNWYYGASVKFINSNYGIYRSNALAFDVGLAWYDSTRLLQAALLFKNVGTQLKQYANSRADDLPFDVQAGVTKRLAAAPVQFSLTAHHLHRFNIRYNDTSYNNSNGFSQDNGDKSFTLDKLFRHFVLAGQVFLGNKIELTLAYNYLLHKELVIANTANGFTGLSFGVGATFKKLQLRYARNHYQNNTAYNQFGLNMLFNR